MMEDGWLDSSEATGNPSHSSSFTITTFNLTPVSLTLQDLVPLHLHVFLSFPHTFSTCVFLTVKTLAALIGDCLLLYMSKNF